MKALKAFIKPFAAPQRNVKIKIYLKFFTLSGIGPLRVNLVVGALTHYITHGTQKGSDGNSKCKQTK